MIYTYIYSKCASWFYVCRNIHVSSRQARTGGQTTSVVWVWAARVYLRKSGRARLHWKNRYQGCECFPRFFGIHFSSSFLRITVIFRYVHMFTYILFLYIKINLYVHIYIFIFIYSYVHVCRRTWRVYMYRYTHLVITNKHSVTFSPANTPTPMHNTGGTGTPASALFDISR